MTSPDDSSLRLAHVPGKGLGVVTARSYRVGEALMRFRGPIAHATDVRDRDRWLQVGEASFMGPSGDLDDWVNHSCEPNCGLFEEPEGPVLRALVPIACGDEACFDYAMWMAGDLWHLPVCACGATGCRGRIGDFETLPADLQQAALAVGCVPAFAAATRRAGRRECDCP